MTTQISEYIDHGWSLVPIRPGAKGPRGTDAIGWNVRGNGPKRVEDVPAGYGVGLAHAYSGTMAFDIDHWFATSLQGIDLDGLYAADDAVIIDSGREGHGKLLYQMPFGLTLPSKQLHASNVLACEFRCATMEGLTVQDVLPPTIHPDTKQPYTWKGKGHWSRLPMIPIELLNIWYDLLKQDQKITVTVDGVDASWDEIRDALRFITPDCSRDEWIHAGMALHWTGIQTYKPEEALSVWNEWSRPSAKYPGEKAILGQWHSFRHAPILFGET